MIPTLQFTVRSAFRMWIRRNRAVEDEGGTIRRYCRERCGFNKDRWRRLYGREGFGRGIKEIFSNP